MSVSQGLLTYISSIQIPHPPKMIVFLTFLMAFGLTVVAQSTTASTTSVFLPIVDAQSLVASVSASVSFAKSPWYQRLY